MMVTLDDQLTGVLRPGVLCVEQVRVVAHDPAMDLPIMETERALRASGDPAGVVAAVRRLYHRTGVDPTKTRPSSEALLRRLRKGQGLPRINSLVDVANWCSLETQLPYGLYDLDCVHGAVQVRLGRAGEQYAGIRKDTVHVDGRITLVDDDGPFGNPTSDSARTMVHVATARALFVVFAPAELGDDVVSRALDLTAARALRFCGGRETARALAGPS